MKYDELAKYLMEGPLYLPKPLDDVATKRESSSLHDLSPYEPQFPVPKEAERQCPTCRFATTWRWNDIPGSAERIGLGLKWITYRCKNCGGESFSVWILVALSEGRLIVEKVGQHPKLEITLPPDFEKALGKSKDLYIKGMRSRHAGYGIGALAYLRRVVDDRIYDMLELLEAAMVETGAEPAAIETVRRARAGKVFDERVRLAAEVMPAHLKPGGMNPFADLYELQSGGLHEESDEECCEIVDAMDEAMKYVFTELKGRTESAAHYKQAATNIQKALAERRARKQGQAGT
jgi:hypothetical protein